MKYIVDLPKEYISVSSLFGKILSIPIQINGGKNYNIPTSIKITPYTEPDRTQIEDEVWDFASLLMNMHPDVAEHIYWSMNGGKGIGVAAEMTYSEAKTKYDEWRTRKDNEAKAKQKDEIKVGDEVEYTCCKETVRFVVTDVVGDTAYGFKYPCDYDDVGEYCALDQLRKTGRHFTLMSWK